MVVQEQGTISGITVAENLFLGQEQRFHRLGMISSSRMNKAAKEILRTIGFDHIDPSERIDRFNMQDRKLFEVAKVMHNQPELLIVDESTTALSQRGRRSSMTSWPRCDRITRRLFLSRTTSMK